MQKPTTHLTNRASIFIFVITQVKNELMIIAKKCSSTKIYGVRTSSHTLLPSYPSHGSFQTFLRGFINSIDNLPLQPREKRIPPSPSHSPRLQNQKELEFGALVQVGKEVHFYKIKGEIPDRAMHSWRKFEEGSQRGWRWRLREGPEEGSV